MKFLCRLFDHSYIYYINKEGFELTRVCKHCFELQKCIYVVGSDATWNDARKLPKNLANDFLFGIERVKTYKRKEKEFLEDY